jgi:hypothetical protein
VPRTKEMANNKFSLVTAREKASPPDEVWMNQWMTKSIWWGTIDRFHWSISRFWMAASFSCSCGMLLTIDYNSHNILEFWILSFVLIDWYVCFGSFGSCSSPIFYISTFNFGNGNYCSSTGWTEWKVKLSSSSRSVGIAYDRSGG